MIFNTEVNNFVEINIEHLAVYSIYVCYKKKHPHEPNH